MSDREKEGGVDWDRAFQQATQDLPEEERLALERVHQDLLAAAQRIRRAIDEVMGTEEGRELMEAELRRRSDGGKG